MERDKRAENTEWFLTELQRCISGLRQRDAEEALSGAEVHSAFLRLTEDDDFAARFKKRWQEVYAEDNSEPWVDKPLDMVPDLVQCFIITLTEYMGIN